MQTDRILKSLVLLLCTILPLGCVRENDLSQREEFREHHFKLEVSIGADLRAEENGEDARHENQIKHLQVFFFNKSGVLDYKSELITSPIIGQINKYLIPITNNQTLFDGRLHDIYIVANHPEIDAESPSALKEVILNASLNQPDKFVMLAELLDNASSLSNVDIQGGAAKLSRRVAKIRFNLPELVVVGFVPNYAAATVTLHNVRAEGRMVSNGTNQGDLMADAGLRTLVSNRSGKYITKDPFYVYYTKWDGIADAQAPYLMLSLPGTKAGAAVTYQYKITLSRTKAGVENSQIDQNYLYDVTSAITTEGSTPSIPTEVGGFVYVIPWGDADIPATDVTTPEYLFPAERSCVMNSITTYSIDYKSSFEAGDLEITDFNATYTFNPTYADGEIIYDSDIGQTVTVQYVTGASSHLRDAAAGQVPTVQIEADEAKPTNGRIVINSTLPTNYLIKDIRFKIRPRGSVSSTVPAVTITGKQYPGTYVLATKGIGTLGSGLNNKSIYHIKTLIPGSFPPLSNPTLDLGNIIFGYPRTDGSGYTVNDQETRNTVSPSFELASQLGATQPMSYANAKTRCRDYSELRSLPNGGTETLADWRLPTEAEIHLVDYMQREGLTVRAIMTGRYYWSGWAVNKSTGGWLFPNDYDDEAVNITAPFASGIATTRNAHVRCVRDVKDQ